ncbi:glycosyl hydrolase family 28 protein [Paenibacillus prosopidis]|uniref:Glycosyl hydrolase family 28 n=1 Tax=Paenibacillus prosopidis TaxID=630520 RepID=A0A368VUG2_9BACL|nr:glycosyl hydrolase family 28 protein [Paenibacillus prosopidis]RCW45443.1 glycosyl hydrolase family 28 [Paenibacillus prosopidis]
MISTRTELITYPAPLEAVVNNDFSVRVRLENGVWHELFPYLVPVDMHNVRETSMVSFDFEGVVEVEVTKRDGILESVDIRPNSFEIPFNQIGNTVTFKLDRPRKLSFEANGERFHNLHLFANPLETNVPDLEDPRTIYIKPGNHRMEELVAPLTTPSDGEGELPEILYFGPGMHFIEEKILRIPSGKTVYIAGGAMVVGSMICDHVEDVTIRGRGIVYLTNIEKTTYLRTVQIDFSRNITVEGIISVDPPHYSIHLGKSEHVHISNFKTFSTRGWSDGIDMMSCSYVNIDDVFLRTSDDCIAIYGSRGIFYGDSTNISVRNSVLWADVAHPMMIGVHGDHEHDGDIIENIVFDNIDILEHHEPQDGYWGCMTINAADKNTVRNVTYKNIRVEQFELGRLIDIRVFQNPKYNPSPGNRVENIRFENIEFNGICENPSVIEGFDGDRIVDGITIENFRINGIQVTDALSGNIQVGKYVNNVVVK